MRELRKQKIAGTDEQSGRQEIIERGSHDELLEKKGRYYQLYTGQFELD